MGSRYVPEFPRLQTHGTQPSAVSVKKHVSRGSASKFSMSFCLIISA